MEAAWEKVRAETPPPGLMVIDHTLAGYSYRFYPRKVTPAKARLSATLPGFTAPTVTLMLGSEPEVDANGAAILTYGLEAEADGTGSVGAGGGLTATLPSLNPHDNSTLAEVSMAGKKDIDKAVEAERSGTEQQRRRSASLRDEALEYLVAKDAVQVLAIHGVMDVPVGMRSASSDGEAIHSVVRFRPPAIQHGQVQAAVQHHFLTARSGCF